MGLVEESRGGGGINTMGLGVALQVVLDPVGVYTPLLQAFRLLLLLWVLVCGTKGECW